MIVLDTSAAVAIIHREELAFAVRDPQRSELGTRLVALRRARRIKQESVADVVGISISTYSRIECGVLTPQFWQLSAIAAALHVSVSELYENVPTAPAR